MQVWSLSTTLDRPARSSTMRRAGLGDGLLRALWVSVGLLLALRVVQGARAGFDLGVVLVAGQHLLDGQPVYDDPFFLYLPSAALLAAPLALLPGSLVVAGGALAAGLAIVWVVTASVRLLNPAAPDWLAPTVLVGALISLPGGALVYGANTEFVALAALPLLYRWAADRRWTRFGLLLGLTVAVKPILVGLVLLPLLARRWRAVGWAVVVPVVLSALALALMPDRGQLLGTALPRLLGGPPTPFLGVDASLSGVLRGLGVGEPWSLAARAAVALLGLGAAVVRWHRPGDPTTRVVESGTLVVLTTTVASSVAWDHYALFAIPALVLVTRPDALVRRGWLMWPCLLPLLAEFVPPAPAGPLSYGVRAGVALLALLVVLAGTALRRPRAPQPAEVGPDQPPAGTRASSTNSL
ncbi:MULTISPECIES: glycosyltransferase 87 family protein [unclassified Modestobacter]